MATYRVFMFGEDNHIVGAAVIDCASDHEAILRAPAVADGHQAVEVWELARCVGRVDLLNNTMRKNNKDVVCLVRT